jgi:hypothetical protein
LINQYIRIIITLLFLITKTSDSFAQISGRIIYKNDSTSIRNSYKTQENFISTINKEIKKLHRNGYINAALDSTYIWNDSATAIIYKGEKKYWKKFGLNYDKKTSFKIPPNKLKKRSPVDLIKLNDYKEKVISVYENNGYPFVKLTPSTTLLNDSIEITFHIEPGKMYKFDSLIYNKFKISRNFLSGYLNIKPNELYNENTFQRIPTKIEQLPFLALRANPSITFGNDLARVQLILEEKKSNFFNGLIGLVPDPDEENKYLITGDIDLTLNNAIGKGEHLQLNWKKNDRYSQELDAKLRWPYIFKLPLGFEGQINMLKQDTSYVEVESRTGVFIYFNGSNTASGYYKNAQTIVLNPIDTTNIKKTNTYGTGITLELKNQDNYLNPSKGYLFSIDISGGKRNTLDSLNREINAGYADGKIKIEGFIPLYRNWTLNLKSTFAGVYSDKELYINEYMRTGGLKSFRGFDENEFVSNGYNINTIEIRWLFENLSHFKVFSDFGILKTRNQYNTLINKALGVGAGLNLHTNAGIFSISYALGRYHNTNFRLNNAKIHFGYINSF